nr:hypothetical protein [Pseudonocardiales bacterium]
MSAADTAAPVAPEATELLLRGLVGFTTALRHAGVPVSTERVAAFLAALDAVEVTSEPQAYWAGRLTLCGDPDDVARYDAAFAAWFSGDPLHQPNWVTERRPPRLATLTPQPEPESDADGAAEQ